MHGSMKLKKAIALGKVTVHNPKTGEANLFLLNAKHQQVSVVIPGKGTKEIAPKFCPLANVLKSRNLNSLLKAGHLRIV